MIVIPHALNVNKVFKSASALVAHAEHRAENSPRLDCQLNAFTLMIRIEPHKRGYKLVSMFYLDNGLVAQMTYNDDTLYAFREAEEHEFITRG